MRLNLSSEQLLDMEGVPLSTARFASNSSQLRSPLCPIQLPLETQDPRVDPVTPGEKHTIPEALKTQFHAETAENATPEKHVLSLSSSALSLSSVNEAASINSKNRYFWLQHQNQHPSDRAATTVKPKCECSHSVYSTPSALGGAVKPFHARSDSNGTPFSALSVTPRKTISRISKHGSASGSAFSNSRKTVGFGSVPPKGINPNIPPAPQMHFDLEEDLSFWKDHNVQVLIRIRPINSSEVAIQGYNRCLRQESAHSVAWTGQPDTRFTFDHVACETTTQEKLFHVVGLPIVENCMSGYNSCIFAYGQTGSGKTYTMLGDIEALNWLPSKDRGMTTRVFEHLFVRIKMEEEAHKNERLKYKCKCSFLEIYNEQITDLLEPSSTNLQLREDSKKGVYVDNLSEVDANNVQDVIQLLVQGASNRKVAATSLNRESSRSHSVFTCVIESTWQGGSVTSTRFSRLHLVDLAGSERQKGSGVEGERLKEAAYINKSLSAFGFVIMILVDVTNGRQRHVPYRDSKLTFLLQDSLGGNSKTLIIATVSPSSCCSMETLSTLKFAQRAKFLQNNAVVNEETCTDVLVLRQQVQLLMEEVNRLRFVEDNAFVSDDAPLGSTVVDAEDGENLAMGVTKQCQITKCPCNPGEYAEFCEEMQQKLRALESLLRGSFRREQMLEGTEKYLNAEMEHLNRLVRQREDEAQCGKMMLRFREEKIRRLESLTDCVMSADKCLAEERKALVEELQLVRNQIDRNPEVTRFAMENIRLMEQLRRFDQFYEQGEREVMLEEISDLRTEVQELLDEIHVRDEEKDALTSQIENYRNELDKCQNDLNAYMEENETFARRLMELEKIVSPMEVVQKHQHQELEPLKSQNYEQEDPIVKQALPEVKQESKVVFESAFAFKNSKDKSFETVWEKEVQENLCPSCMQSESAVSYFQGLQNKYDCQIRQLQVQLQRVESDLREEQTISRQLEDVNFELRNRLEEPKSCLKEENTMFEAQALFSLHELDALLVQYRQVVSCLSSSEEREQILKDHIKQIESKLRESDVNREETEFVANNADKENKGSTSATEQSALKNMQKTIIIELVEPDKSNVFCEKEGDELDQRSQGRISFLLKELEVLKHKCTELSNENTNLTILYGGLLRQKDSETKEMCKDWEDATVKLIDYLSEGDQALHAATKEMEEMIEESFSNSDAFEIEKNVSLRMANKQTALEFLQKKLEEAYSLSRNMENEIRAFIPDLKKQDETPETVYEITSNASQDKRSVKPTLQLINQSQKLLLELPRDDGLVESKAETSRTEFEKRKDVEFANVSEKLKSYTNEQGSCAHEGKPVRNLEFEIKQLEEVAQEMKEQMFQENCKWKKERDVLLVDLNQAKLEAAEKNSEAAMLLRNFEACQNTLSEADFLLNALVKANESAKSEAKCWKDALCCLTQKQKRRRKDSFDDSLDYDSISSQQRKDEALQSIRTNLFDVQSMQQRCSQETNYIAINSDMIATGDEEENTVAKQNEGALTSILATMINEISSDVHELCGQISFMFSDISSTKTATEHALLALKNSWLLLKEDIGLNKVIGLKNVTEKMEQQCQQIEALESDVSGYRQKGKCAEGEPLKMEGLVVQINHLKDENCRKDELHECLELDLAFIQECTAERNDESETKQAKNTTQILHKEIDAKTRAINAIDLNVVDAETGLEKEQKAFQVVKEEPRWLNQKAINAIDLNVVDAETGLEKEQKAFQVVKEEPRWLNQKALAAVDEPKANAEIVELKQKCHCLEEELENKHHAMETLAAELLEVTLLSDTKMSQLLETSKEQLDAISQERDQLKEELQVLSEKLEVSRQFISEHEIIVAEVYQVAEDSKTRAEEKEAVINLLEGTVMQLKRTIHSLEDQVGILKRETEIHRSLREDREMEIQVLKHQMSKVHPVIDWNADECNQQHVQIDNREQISKERHMQLRELQNQIERLQAEVSDKNKQINSFKSYIEELVSAAEIQSNEHQKQIKALNLLVEHIKLGQVRATSSSSTLNRGAERSATKNRRSNSPFRCINFGMSHQFSYETEKELLENRHQIDELQQVAIVKQKEIFTLKARLAEAESMTHDVLRDLLGVKMDITCYASSLSHQALLRYIQKSNRETCPAEETAEICRLKEQLDELIHEKESWLEGIDCKQTELNAAQVAVQKFKLRNQRLTKNYERLKAEYSRQKKLIADLEKVRMSSESNTGMPPWSVNEARTYFGIDKEKALDHESDCEHAQATSQKRSQEIEVNQLVAQNLSSLCKSIMQVAGISSGRDPKPSTAMEVLHELSNRLQSTEQELAHIKLKRMITGEKTSLRKLRDMQFPLTLTGYCP